MSANWYVCKTEQTALMAALARPCSQDGLCETVQSDSVVIANLTGTPTRGLVSERGGRMSALNGDRARFRKDRARKLRHRQRIHALAIRLRATPMGHASAAVTQSVIDALVDGAPVPASLALFDEESPAVVVD